MLLEKIQKENDIKQLKPEELEKLAEEIRQFLVEKISVTDRGRVRKSKT
jgi:1-deoxy-D-xylulose-5-phosphate synthase